MIYTSGSTGQPKGVLIEQKAIVNQLLWLRDQYQFDSTDVLLQKTACIFDASVWELLLSPIVGAKMVLSPPGAEKDPAALAEAIVQKRITTIQLVPTMLRALLLSLRPGQSFNSLRRCFCGGESLTPELTKRFFDQFGDRTELHNLYGPTETAIDAAFYPVSSPEDAIPIGRPVANTSIYILDRNKRPVPIGVAGELCIGGVQVGRGYLNRPELTAERFIVNPFRAGERLYRSGDLARWRADGNIEYLGRLDHQVKIRGYRIELGEIEAVLSQHAEIGQAVVVAREEKSGSKALCAYVVGKESSLETEELRNYLNGKLPKYMVPTSFVKLESFPLTGSGKVDRKALPAPDLRTASKQYLAARNELEEQLAKLWQEVLGVQPIGVTDDFFALGGHSLLAVRIFAEIERIFEKKLPLATLFQSPTVEKLAAALREQGWKPTWSPLVAIQPRGPRPPFFAVHGGYGEVMFYSELARCLGEDQPFYGLQAEGLDGSPIRHTCIEAIARYYLREIRRVQAHGPYFLGGYCTGGLVALEMAQQLRAVSEDVALLALFDTTHPKERNLRYPIKKRIRLALDEARALPPSEKMRYFAQRAAHRLKWEVSKLQKAGYDLKELLYKMQKPDRESTNGGPLPLKMPVWLMLHRAQSAYKPHAYPGRIVLFRAITSDGRQRVDDRGWTGIAEGGLEIHDMPSKHGTLFESRYMPAFAEKLDACIRTARTSQSAEISRFLAQTALGQRNPSF